MGRNAWENCFVFALLFRSYMADDDLQCGATFNTSSLGTLKTDQPMGDRGVGRIVHRPLKVSKPSPLSCAVLFA